MTFDQDDLAALVAGLEAAEEFRPIVQKGVAALQSFGPEIKSLFMGISLGMAEINTAIIHKYEDAGFIREEAIQIWATQTIQTIRLMENAWAMKKKS